jgi:hypothetical protein
LEVDGRRRNHSGITAQPAHRGTTNSRRHRQRGRGQQQRHGGTTGPAYRQTSA